MHMRFANIMAATALILAAPSLAQLPDNSVTVSGDSIATEEWAASQGYLTNAAAFDPAGSATAVSNALAAGAAAGLTALQVEADPTVAGAVAAHDDTNTAHSALFAAKQNGVIIAIEGDSRTAPGPTTNYWPDYISAVSPLFKSAATVTNFATGGHALGQMVTQYATQAHTVAPESGQAGYFILIGGANDMGTGLNKTGAETYGYATQLWALARADGYMVVASTETGDSSWGASNTAQCAAFNVLVRSDPTLYDYLIEPDVEMPFSQTTWYYDTIHWSDPTGATVFAKLVAETLSGPRSSQNTNAVTRFPGKVYAGATDLSAVTTDATSITTGNLAASRITNALAAGLSDMTISPSLVKAGTAVTYSQLEGVSGSLLLRSLNPYVYLDDRSSGEGNWFISADGDDMYFTVDSDAPLNGEAMRIKGDGKVGVGTNGPGAALHVYPSAADVKGQIIRAQTGQSAYLLDIQNAAGGTICRFGADGALNYSGVTIINSTEMKVTRIQNGSGNDYARIDLGSTDTKTLLFTTDTKERARIPSTGGWFLSAYATNMLAAIDGKAGIFSAQDSGDTNNVELWSIDDQGNVTLQTSHDGLTAVHKSHNLYTGKGRVMDLDAMGAAITAIATAKDWKEAQAAIVAAGGTNIYTTYSVPAVDWDAEQAAEVAKSQAAISAWMSDTNAVEVKGAKPKLETAKPKPAWLVDALKPGAGVDGKIK